MSYSRTTYIKTIFLLLLSVLAIRACKRNIQSDNTKNTIDAIEKQKTTSQIQITTEFKALETLHTEMLKPIVSLKTSDPKIYWFIVSWLNTNYKTPDWNNYGSKNWRIEAKKRGIDCSGFSRIMLDQIFNKKVRGGSQGILNDYTKPIKLKNIKMGDLVFFRAPYSTNDRIVHVGVYLMDDYFVHATSTKSAAKGLGLMISSLEEKNWKKEFVVAGRVNE